MREQHEIRVVNGISLFYKLEIESRYWQDFRDEFRLLGVLRGSCRIRKGVFVTDLPNLSSLLFIIPASYEPPPSPQGPSRTTSTTSITQAQPPSDSLSNLQINQTTSTSTDPTSIPSSSTTSNVPETTSTTRRRPQRSGTLPPDTEDLEAARVAREIEERENLENLNRDGNQPPPDLVESSGSVVEGNSVNQGGGVAEGAPPGYEEACER